MTSDRFSEAIRSREDYDEYETAIKAKKAKIEDPHGNGRALIDQVITELDTLYESHTMGTSNSVIIEADQRAFKNTVDILSERMKNQARGVPGEITMESMINSLASQASVEDTGSRLLQTMGALFSRGSKVAPVELPTLGYIKRSPVHAPRYQTQRQPTGKPETSGVAEGKEFLTEIIQRRTQGKIMTAVVNDEAVNDFEPLLLYRLCFDKHSFVRTLENFFAASVLVKEQKLWIGANKRGLPVVGSVRHRPRYLANHANSNDASGPDPSIDLASFGQPHAADRQQVNFNFDMHLYELQKKLFGDEDSLIVRNDYDDYDDDDNDDGGEDHSGDNINANGGRMNGHEHGRPDADS